MTPRTTKTTVRLQERDIELFNWLYKFRFLDVYQIAGLLEPVEKKLARPDYQFKGSQEAIFKRVKLLTRAGYLDSLTKITPKFIYTLGPKAIDVLVLESGIPREEILHTFEQKKRGEKHLSHSLMIAEFGACLAMACKQRGDVELITWLPESNDRQIEVTIPEHKLTETMKKWKSKRGVSGLTLTKKPDAIFGLEDKGGKMFFVLEVDRGTMTSSRFLQKMVCYYNFLAQKKFSEWSFEQHIHPEGKSIKFFRVITYTVTPQWQKTLINTSLKVNSNQTGSKMFWFTNQTLLDTQNTKTIFDYIFSIAQIDELTQPHSLLE